MNAWTNVTIKFQMMAEKVNYYYNKATIAVIICDRYDCCKEVRWCVLRLNPSTPEPDKCRLYLFYSDCLPPDDFTRHGESSSSSGEASKG